MKAVFDKRQFKHHPKQEIRYGKWDKSDEQPKRAEILLDVVQKMEIPVDQPQEIDEAYITRVHSKRYVSFLKTIHARWQKVDGASDDVYPSVHPNAPIYNYPGSLLGQAGFHLWETGAPVGPDTWEAAKASASTALHAAKLIESGRENKVYALCRPPGHHATVETAGGYCYLCNSAIAADYLSSRGRRVAIVDVDLHHGNGTQNIFYNRDDVLTISIHAHPDTYFPYFWGFENEKGAGKGLGYNHNIVLPPGTKWDNYSKALEQAFELVAGFKADVLLIGLGLDTHEIDPYGGMLLTLDDFTAMGKKFAATGLPLLAVQEGGYISEALGPCLHHFLKGLQA